MSLVRPLRLLLLGAPGSGKGTQTLRLLKEFPLINPVLLGDILRHEMAEHSAIGRGAAQYIQNGELVPDRTMIALITGHLLNPRWAGSSPSALFLLDGFPRTLNQAHQLDELLHPRDKDLNMVVELDVDQNVILERIEARWVHVDLGRVYNLDYNPPKTPFRDDVTGEPLTKRDDDTAAVFQKRLDTYNRELAPLKQYYAQKGVLHTVLGNTLDIIYPKLAALIRDKFSK